MITTKSGSTSPNTKLERKLDAFAEYLCARRGLAEFTISAYIGTIRRLVPTIGLNPPHHILDAMIVRMRKSGASSSHVVNTSLALERYTEFIGNPIQLGRPKKPKRMIRGTLTEAEITLLLAACRNVREKAILTLLAYSGLRNKEVCGLTIAGVDVASQIIHVHRGKGQKDRDASIAAPCAGLVLEYLHRDRAGAGPEEPLFVTLPKGNPYLPQDLRKLVRVVARRAHISKRVYPHLFRHSLATNMLIRGAHILAIKEQLGHAFVETMMVYLHATPIAMQAQYRFFAPSYP
ncbi:MAG TPA: tyrosine-type recombinase/integrase [Bryobacteraceae bacterium]|nr:tyrosine-type recombinase/integrase [Bryobacteraceae bacterium]